MRVKFRELFEVNADGSLSPRGTLIFGKDRLTATSILRKGAAFNGVDIHAIAGHDLEIEDIGDAFEVRMVYFG